MLNNEVNQIEETTQRMWDLEDAGEVCSVVFATDQDEPKLQ